MAHTANERSTSATWSQGARVKSTKFEIVESNAAGAVSRAASKSGTMNYPITYGGSNSTTTVGMYYNSNGEPLLLNTVSYVIFPLSSGLPDAHTLTSVTLNITPASGHAAEPAVLPLARIQVLTTAGVAENLGSATVSWSSVAGYESGVQLAMTSLAHTIDLERNRYQVWLQVESGSSSVNGSVLGSMKVGCTIDTSSGGTDLAHWLKA